ncbi:uncharacterized protein ATC70_007172 [Mucor velutinosus]|uniref:Uncharacterized protein n=1 Tax=Mucor velutinosus TaxID=708070 RepID=A0AAN7D391_9FUNG|nr:hypothetical protein ATC70_007172 [Mucor velutinosus]
MLLYPDELNIVGFKTDVRFIAQVGASFDLASGEACLIQPGKSKAIDDQLMREGKRNAMALYEVTSTKITHAWMFQFIGLQAVFSTVTYFDYDLHVATLQEKIHFPDSVTSFTNTRNTTKFIGTLLKFQFDLNRTARLIQDTIDQADRSLLLRENIFEPMEHEAPSTQAPPSALSFYTPPKKKDLTRAKYPQANQEALLSGAEALIQVAQEATATRD